MSEWQQVGSSIWEHRSVNCKVCDTGYADCWNKDDPCCETCRTNDTHADVRVIDRNRND